jgi:hypothetical protein
MSKERKYMIEYFTTHGNRKIEWVEAKDGAQAHMIAMVSTECMSPQPRDFMVTEYNDVEEVTDI